MGKAKIAVLAAVIAIAAVSGTWLMLSPALEKQSNLDRQAELMASIAEGGGVIVFDETATAEPVNFYDEPIIEIDTAEQDEPTEAVTTPKPITEVITAAIPTETEIVTEPPTEPIAETETPKENSMTGTGILTIEKIGLKLPVVDGVTEEQLKIAVGRVTQTAAIGEPGNAVIAGHRSYTYGDYFNRLGEMENGDIIGYAPINGESMRFEVFEIIDIQPGDPIAFVQPEDESIITLYTCTPIRKATHRLLVRAIKL